MADEQRVRTMCGWIGVEISKSRVRTPGRAGYGLYRARGSVSVTRQEFTGVGSGTLTVRRQPTEWTAYAFTLEEIERAATAAIDLGTPSGPFTLHLSDGTTGQHVVTHRVPTRWTQAYRGRRDLGVSEPVAVRPEYADKLSALAALVDEGLVEMRHVGDGSCSCSDTARMTAACVRLTTGDERVAAEVLQRNAALRELVQPLLDLPEGERARLGAEAVRQRRREFNAAFQAEHGPRRDAGLVARHAAKLSRSERRGGSTGPGGDEKAPPAR